MLDFAYTALPARVLFGRGKLSVAGEEARRLGMANALIITGRQQAELGNDLAKAISGTPYPMAVMHTPVDVTEKAVAFVLSNGIDGIVALGGGSSTGLGKAIALRTDLPQVVIPTSYAGSEMTNILGETADGSKTTKRDPRIQPECVIYDPDLVAGLPAKFAATSGMNAIAHAVEGLYAADRNPITSLMAEEGIRALASALPDGPRGAERALYGAWLCGTVLGSVAMALHHKLCHVLGGSFGLPHADTHAAILPHATAYNSQAAPDAMAKIARALGVANAAAGLQDLARKIGAPVSLQEIGMKECDLDRAAEIAAANPYPNPRVLELGAIRELLDNAFHGRPPAL